MEFKENTDFDLIGLGEVMLRLSPPNKEKISQSETFEKNAGGSELNVVSGAAMLGIRSAIVTKLPENKMGHFIRNKMRLFLKWTMVCMPTGLSELSRQPCCLIRYHINALMTDLLLAK